MEVKIEKCKECGKSYKGSWMDERARKLEEKQLCFNCSYWSDLIPVRNNAVIVDGVHYMIGPEDKGGMRGFGGRRFDVVFFNGKRITTTNLWHQGTVPDHFRNRLPDNARFIED